MKAILFSLFLITTTFAATDRFENGPCSEQESAINEAGYQLAQCTDRLTNRFGELYGIVSYLCTCDATAGTLDRDCFDPNPTLRDGNSEAQRYAPELGPDPLNQGVVTWSDEEGHEQMRFDRLMYTSIEACVRNLEWKYRDSRRMSGTQEEKRFVNGFFEEYPDKKVFDGSLAEIITILNQYKDLYGNSIRSLTDIDAALTRQALTLNGREYPSVDYAKTVCICEATEGASSGGSLKLSDDGLQIDTDSQSTLDLTKRIAVIEGDDDPTRTGDLSLDGGDQPGVDPTPAAGSDEDGDNGRIVINPDHYGQQSSLRFVDCHGDDVAGVKDGPAQGANWSAQLMNGNCWAVAFSNLLSISGGDGLQKTRISPTHLAAQVNLYQCFNVGEDYKLDCSQTESCNNLPDYDKNCLDENIGFKSQEPCSIMNNLKHDISVCPNQRENKSMVSEIGHLYYSSLSDLFRTYQEVKGDCDQCGNTFLVEQLGLNASPFEEVLACLETEDTYKNLVGIMCLYEKDCEGEAISLSKESAQGLLSCQNLSEVGDTNRGIENIQDSLDHGLPIGITFCYSKLVKKNRPCPILHSGVILGRSTYMEDGQRKQAFLLNPGFGTDLCQSLMNNEETDSNAISCDVDENGELTGNIWVTEEKLADQNLQNTWAISSTKLRDSDIYQQLTRDCPEQGDSDGGSGSGTDPKKELDWLDDDGDFEGKVGPITGSATGGV